MILRITDFQSRVGIGLWAVTAVLLVGCPAPNDRDLHKGLQEAEARLSYPEFARAYNRRVAKIERLWSRVTMEVRWTDEDGRKQFEQGDGQLIVRKPNELALAIGRLGNTMYWLGCDAERYWMFDLNPPEDQPKTAYIGSRALAHTHRLPLPINPNHLLGMLGIQALPTDAHEGHMHWHNNGTEGMLHTHFVQINDTQQGAIDPAQLVQSRVVFDVPGRRLRERVAVRGEDDLLLRSTLSKYKPLKRVNQPPGAFPDVATRFEMELPPQKARLSLTLSELTDDPKKIKDVQFDPAKLIRMLKVARVIDLDRADRPGDAPANSAAP